MSRSHHIVSLVAAFGLGASGCVELFADLPAVDAFVVEGRDHGVDVDGSPPDVSLDGGVESGVESGVEVDVGAPDARADAQPRATVCTADDPTPPCNGAPAGTEIPAGWVYIPPGSFTLGSPEGEGENRFAGVEGPQQPVNISGHFLMMRTELSQGEWRALARADGTVGESPSYFDGDPGRPCDDEAPDRCPVERINLVEALWAANALSARDGHPLCYEPARIGVEMGCAPAEDATCCSYAPGAGCDVPAAGHDNGARCGLVTACSLESLDVWRAPVFCSGVRLPTAAEWAYAARAGTSTRYWFGDDPQDLLPVAWYRDSANGRTHRVDATPDRRGTANPWGLVNMIGNVGEMVIDRFGPWPNPPPAVPLRDPHALVAFLHHVQVRGCTWDNTADACRIAHRGPHQATMRSSYHGVRFVRSLPPEPPRGPRIERVEPLPVEPLYPGDTVTIRVAVDGGRGPIEGILYAGATANRQPTAEVARFEQVGDAWQATIPWSAVNIAAYRDLDPDAVPLPGRTFRPPDIDLLFVVRFSDADGRADQAWVQIWFACGTPDAPTAACDGVCLDDPKDACPEPAP